jgi:hypothetical protein
VLGEPSATTDADATDTVILRELLDLSFRRAVLEIVDTHFDAELLYIFLSAHLLNK